MNRLIGKLLRRHISIGQLAGFFCANLVGMIIILLSIQFYTDIKPLFGQEEGFMNPDYLIVSKKVSSLGSLAGKSNSFSEKEIEDLKGQPFVRRTGVFTPSMFDVSAGIDLKAAGVQLSTIMFFESVPDEFVDIDLNKWGFDGHSRVIPIVVPRNYLNLYNFGFAESKNLPKLSEGIIGLIHLDITLSGNGKSEQFKGNIVGFSNRLNTILAPQAFMDWANNTFAPRNKPQPSRLILETGNPADKAIAAYFNEKGYETEGDKLDAGKTAYFLKIIVGIVAGIGLLICVLSFYLFMLSIFLLLQKNSSKLENLLLIGYSPRQISRPYRLLTIATSSLVLLLAVAVVLVLRLSYMNELSVLFSTTHHTSVLPMLATGILLVVLVSAINVMAIKRYVDRLFFKSPAG